MAPRVCLNAIVRNEESNVTRLLDSLAGVVCEFVIVDTGSDDGTVAAMERHPIPGVVGSRPFDNFGRARTHALRLCGKKATAEWVLLMDADMVLCGSLEHLPDDADVVSLVQVQGGLRYTNVRLIRRSILEAVSCVGATHEFYDIPEAARHVVFDAAWIDDRGDGGCKADKFTRDLMLLEKQRPRNARCVFYMAQTHLALGNIDEALKWYVKRMKMGGGFELETDYARQQALVCHLHKNDLAAAQKLFSGTREDCAALACFLRERGDNIGAWTYATKGLASAPRDRPVLFEDVHVDERLAFERSIAWHYITPDMPRVGLAMCMTFLDSAVDASRRSAVLANTRFYVRALSTNAVEDASVSLEGPWHSSTPCSGSGDVVRFVNYTIDPATGRYAVDGPVRSRLFRGSTEITVHCGECPVDGGASCLGVEDVRLGSNGAVLCSSLQYTHTPGIVSQVTGVLVGNDLHLDHVVPSATHEKNWVFAGEVVVYDWFPCVRVGVPTPDGFVFTQTSDPVPRSFEGMRGSSNGVFCKDEWWFVTHNALDCADGRRYYTHRVVVLDRMLRVVVRHTLPFVFTGSHPVEFCVCMETDGTNMTIGFSEGDATTRWIRNYPTRLFPFA